MIRLISSIKIDSVGKPQIWEPLLSTEIDNDIEGAGSTFYVDMLGGNGSKQREFIDLADAVSTKVQDSMETAKPPQNSRADLIAAIVARNFNKDDLSGNKFDENMTQKIATKIASDLEVLTNRGALKNFPLPNGWTFFDMMAVTLMKIMQGNKVNSAGTNQPKGASWCAGQRKGVYNECGRCGSERSGGRTDIFKGTNTRSKKVMELAYNDDYDFSDDGLDEYYQ